MNTMKNTLLILLAIAGLGLLNSCTKSEDEIKPEADYSDILSNLGQEIILKTYQALTIKADELESATQALENDPTDINLIKAKTAWVGTRAPWEQSEGFLFGPVDQEGIDPALDSWPVNVTDLNNVLASNSELTVDFLTQQEGTLKGFHTVEFLLWGENGNKQVSEFTEREFEYLAAASGALARDARQLYNAWQPSGGNFIANVVNAGTTSQVYVSQKSAIEEITNALIIIADEVANGKINDPFTQKDLTLEESQFSNNSKADFANNMRSIKNVYTGKYGASGDGAGVNTIISEKNPSLDSEVVDQINKAIQAIEGIPGTFSTAIFDHQDDVSDAQEAVRELQQLLEEEVLPLISKL